jgi:chromate reductase, NAD(P)H dehydrogenase (quinone)
MRVLAFAASARRGSLNRKLIELAASLAHEVADVDLDLAHFAEFAMPVYDGDSHAAEGLPPGAEALRHRLERADATMIAAPEYNFSIAAPLKNAIDWVSRVRPMPWRGRSIYLMSASPGPIGGIRGLWQTRIPLEGCGALVFPDMFALGQARDAFDERGRLIDETREQRLRQEVTSFLRLVESYGPLWTEPSSPARGEIERGLEDQSEIQPPRSAG